MGSDFRWCLIADCFSEPNTSTPFGWVHAPQGAYPARGDDRWLALSVQSDAEWATLCRLMQRVDLASDPRFGSPAGRRIHGPFHAHLHSERVRLTTRSYRL